VIPTFTAKQKDNNVVVPDHQDILGELGKCFRNVLGLLQNCTGKRLILLWALEIAV
jgi:hypothetical protein